jgi:nickel/cobalt exporter
MRLVTTFLASVAALLALSSAASAHPHIFIDAGAIVTFNDAGELVSIRNAWTFDEAFSVWQVQGLDVDGDGVTTSAEMQELADENIAGLAQYGFYTSAGDGAETLRFVADGGATFVYADNRSTLRFGIAPEGGPHRIDGRLQIAIADPEYYVAITVRPELLEFENLPGGCSTRLEPPREVSPELQARLFELGPDVTTLPPDLEQALRGTQGAIVIDCTGTAPEAAPATALEAATEVAEARPAMPFGGPPPEPGFNISPTGPLGWMVQLQADFYRGLTGALSALKTDGNAFWILGGLSFLYGVFHAAGPGHGKVVIGSYMLANERQLKRGIALSFAAAMVQSLVAVWFVGIAAAILGLSRIALDGAVVWIERASYGLIVLLGLWLVARKLFGWGHSHDHAPAAHDAHGRRPGDPHYGHDHGDDGHHHHDHDHDHDHGHGHDHAHDEHAHAHAVTPDRTGGDWREQLGVVLSVGLRPCSGALVVLLFALTQGIFVQGIAAVFLMGLGTAITVAVLASIAVGAKGLATRYLGRDGTLAARVVWWAEVAGAVIVLLFGVLLLVASL